MKNNPKKCSDCIHHDACSAWCNGDFPMNDCAIFKTQSDFLNSCPQLLFNGLVQGLSNQPNLLARRKKLFSALADIYQNEQNSPKTRAYIFALWRYIADVHGEQVCNTMDEEEEE